MTTAASNPGQPPTTSVPVDGSTLSQALQITQQSLAAFQKLQEQTAQLHRQFLTQQEASQKTLQLLVEQQHTLILSGMGGAPQRPPMPMPISAPVVAQAPIPQPVPALVPEPVPVVRSPVQIAPVAKVETPVPPVKANEVEHVLLSVVAEKTGYPVEMLSTEMALDSDLGIDSIKRVEILSLLQDRLPNAPAVKAEQLGTFQTLRDIIQYLDKSPADSKPVERNGTVAKLPVVVPAHDIESVLLAVVAEKTGYPVEMLVLEMSLDADLGIDSIKRVEILSTLQDRLPDAPVVKPEQLGQFRTLQDVVTFLTGPSRTLHAPREDGPHAEREEYSYPLSDHKGHGTDPNMEPVVGSAESSRNLQEPEPDTGSVQIDRSILQRVPLDQKEQRRKIVLPKGSTIWVISDPSSLTAKISQFIDSHGYRPQVIAWNDSPYAYGPRGVAGLILIAPEGLLPEDFHLRAFRWLKHAGTGLLQAARHNGAVFAAVTRLDGSFGLGPLDPARDPGMGALLGLVKTAALEWPDVSCKAIDCDPAAMRQLGGPLVEEVFLAGPTEVGLTLTERFTLDLLPATLPESEWTPLLNERDVVLITGGARGVTAAAARPLRNPANRRWCSWDEHPSWKMNRTGWPPELPKRKSGRRWPISWDRI